MFNSLLSPYRLLQSLLFISLLMITACEFASPPSLLSPTISRQEEALAIAKHELPLEGVLEQGSDGFVYLKVSNQYAYRLFPLLEEPGFNIPNSIRRNTKIGAHISVMYKREAQKVGPIHELGQVYTFEPKNIRIVQAGRKKYIILEVDSSQLEQLRQKYGLSPKLMNHDFHITLAEKYTYHLRNNIRRH